MGINKYVTCSCLRCGNSFDKRKDQKLRVNCKKCNKALRAVKKFVLPENSNYSIIKINVKQHESGGWMSNVECKCGFKEDVVNSHLSTGRKLQCAPCSHQDRAVASTLYSTDEEIHISRIFNGMKSRCYNKESSSFKNYGERNITICKEWLDNPSEFVKWSINNGYEKTLTIDRTSNDDGYNPGNCSWKDMKHQQRNRRNNTLNMSLANSIREMRNRNVPYAEIQSKLGVTKWNINDVMNNGTWS